MTVLRVGRGELKLNADIPAVVSRPTQNLNFHEVGFAPFTCPVGTCRKIQEEKEMFWSVFVYFRGSFKFLVSLKLLATSAGQYAP